MASQIQIDDEIKTESRKTDVDSFALIVVVIIISVFAGILAYAIIDGSNTDKRKESDRDIQNCLQQKGTVIVGSDNWFKECRIGP